MFTLRLDGRPVQDLYALLCALLDELEVYQSFVVDIAKMREYREELAIAIFPTALDPEISTQIRGKILELAMFCRFPPHSHVFYGSPLLHLPQCLWLVLLVDVDEAVVVL